MNEICVISSEHYIKARIIKVKTNQTCHIEETIKLAANGLSTNLLSHARIADGYQMFLQPNADGKTICQAIVDALLCLPDGNVVIERINC
ncbi:MAG: hypothetical protein JW943_14910 [Deltaproteobacteria bacterium]|nr:hypothetical protein [Deltaproteobacteria bacterium]